MYMRIQRYTAMSEKFFPLCIQTKRVKSYDKLTRIYRTKKNNVENKVL